MRSSNHRLMGQMEKETSLNDPNHLMDVGIESFWIPNGRREAAVQNYIAVIRHKDTSRPLTHLDGSSQVLQALAHWMGGKRDHFDGKWETFSQGGHSLRLVGNHNKAPCHRGHNFLTQQRPTTSFKEGK